MDGMDYCEECENEHREIVKQLKEQLRNKEQECEELKEKYLELKEQNGSSIVQLNTVNEQLDQLKAENESLKKILKNLLNCPRWCDESTVPKVVKLGLENQDKYAQQIAYNLSVSLSRILEAEQVLQKINEVENEILQSKTSRM